MNRLLSGMTVLLLVQCSFADRNSYRGGITVALTGDIVPGISTEPVPPFRKVQTYLLPGDPFRAFRGLLQSADLTVGNLEGAVCAKALPVNKGRNSYSFRVPLSALPYLKQAGYDLVSIANNHALDCLRDGLLETVSNLQFYGIKASGLYRNESPDVPLPVLLTGQLPAVQRKGVRIAMLSFAASRFFKSVNNPRRAFRLIRQVSSRVDILIVSFHGGAEYSRSFRVPRKMERFYSESRGDLFRFARGAVDAGADLVFGHGPHLLRGMELYRNRLIAYSLGDFCWSGVFSRVSGTDPRRGISALIRVELGRDGTFLGGRIYPVTVRSRGVPLPDPRREAVHQLRSLSRLDFPGSGLVIDGRGVLRVK